MGQKLFRKTFDSSRAEEVHIDARFAYRVLLKTHDSDQIIVEARAEGEYGKDMVINLWQEASTVFISSNFHPDYQAKNDKLSAHKVLSVKLDISLPTGFDVSLSGGSVSVHAEGEYEFLDLVVDSGLCELKEVAGRVNVATMSGDILLNGGKGIVKSISKYGTVESQSLKPGSSEYELNTVKGDISIINKL